MARKPLAQLSPAYRRRIERAEALGGDRRAARGHGPTTLPSGEKAPSERSLRTRKAIASGGLRPIDLDFINRQAAKSTGADREAMVEIMLKKSMAQRDNIMMRQARYHRMYVANGKKTMWSLTGPGAPPAALSRPDIKTKVSDLPYLGNDWPDFELDWMNNDTPLAWYH